VLKDCCWVEEGSVLAPGTVVPPFTIFGGTPAVQKGQLPECFQEMQKEASLTNYSTFLPQPDVPLPSAQTS
jgi:dynactin-5